MLLSFIMQARPDAPLALGTRCRQAVDAPNLKAGRATPAAPAPVVLNFAPGQLPQDLMLFRLLLL